jgi:hypothetical protein
LILLFSVLDIIKRWIGERRKCIGVAKGSGKRRLAKILQDLISIQEGILACNTYKILPYFPTCDPNDGISLDFTFHCFCVIVLSCDQENPIMLKDQEKSLNMIS